MNIVSVQIKTLKKKINVIYDMLPIESHTSFFIHSMADKGYTGHVFVNRKLTVYFSEEVDDDVIEMLVKRAQTDFDHVDHHIIKEKKTIKQFASFKPEQRVENNIGQRGKIGAFAKLNPGNKVVGLSIAHVSKAGEDLRADGKIIGQCIWPAQDDSSATSLQNEISVIKMNEAIENECNMRHDNIHSEEKPIFMNNITPLVHSKVYRGSCTEGFTTGHIISTEARLPLGNNNVEAFLIEGDAVEQYGTLDFATGGDCGSVAKLQREENGKLKAVSMVFGGVLDLPGIEEDTCVTIPLHSAVRRFENATQKRLSFQ